MPVLNNISGIWAMGIDAGANNYPVICESINRSFDLTVSPVTLMAAAGDTLVRSIDTLSSKTSISGPVLFYSTYRTGGFGYPNTLGANAYPYENWECEFDARTYSALLLNYMWTPIYWGGFLGGTTASAIIDSVNMNVADSAEITTTWKGDPPSNGGVSGPGQLLAVNRDHPILGQYVIPIPPLRKGSYYDFLVKITDPSGGIWPVMAKSFSFDLQIKYDEFKPLGGTDYWWDDLGNSAMMHTPIWILQSYTVTSDLSFVTMLNSTTGNYPWGWIEPYGGIQLGLSTQEHDMGVYDLPGMDVVFVSDGTSVIGDFIPWNVGAYIKSVSTSYRPGICESKVGVDWITPLY